MKKSFCLLPSLLVVAKVLMAQKIAKEKGYSDVLYLDAVHKKYLEEVSSCNIFVVKVKLALSLDCALMF
jgi:branched-subunit amino acid aminotransferase/4-amino-4-deoxychorismate lyase